MDTGAVAGCPNQGSSGQLSHTSGETKARTCGAIEEMRFHSGSDLGIFCPASVVVSSFYPAHILYRERGKTGKLGWRDSPGSPGSRSPLPVLLLWFGHFPCSPATTVSTLPCAPHKGVCKYDLSGGRTARGGRVTPVPVPGACAVQGAEGQRLCLEPGVRDVVQVSPANTRRHRSEGRGWL